MIERFRAMHDFPSCDITAEVRKTPNKRIVLGLTAYYGGVYDKQQFIHVLTQVLFCMIDGLYFIPFFYLYSPLIFPGKDGKIEPDRNKYILEVRQ